MRKLFLFTAVVLCLLRISATTAWAQATEQVLYSFTNGSDGGTPLAGVVSDAEGNLYGTTNSGGQYNLGTVFELSPSSGGWTETVLHSFIGGSEGGQPAAGLLIDQRGDLYGTTINTVFKLQHLQAGWRLTVIYTPTEDANYLSGLAADKRGNLFGTSRNGGLYQRGAVFGLQPSKSGWTGQIIYSFGASQTDGTYPYSGLVVGKGEHLYGTTSDGGYGRGTVFELSYSPSGWNEKIVYDFEGGYDGTTPFQSLAIDATGDLFGTTSQGGTSNAGTVFELSPSAEGWTKTVIYNFVGNAAATDGSPTFDGSGNLYCESDYGIIELTPANSGWSANNLFQFNVTDGALANGSLILDASGNIYGTTSQGGGVFGAGVVYEISH
jgi:uncharacterized repeat protein (TIGR03803 family)